ncbi:hypothetical protein [Lonsdalea britannica]|uniref:hypothetical protein n=1 Tax=Lonsdalea britannica TaxID=1082704 RepID=UPI00111C2E7B|nr:hypothetical protein [Lonsdalea britannica]
MAIKQMQPEQQPLETGSFSGDNLSKQNGQSPLVAPLLNRIHFAGDTPSEQEVCVLVERLLI